MKNASRRRFLRGLPAPKPRPGLEPFTPLEVITQTLTPTDQLKALELIQEGSEQFRHVFPVTPAAQALGIAQVVVTGTGESAWVELVPLS